MKILGMDLGQNQSVWETLDTQTGEATRGWTQMDADALRKLLDRTRPDRLVIESGPLAARRHDLTTAAQVAVLRRHAEHFACAERSPSDAVTPPRSSGSQKLVNTLFPAAQPAA